MHAFLHSPTVIGALTGALNGAVAGAAIDRDAFAHWHSWHDAAIYDWGTATFRWFQGAVAGAATGAGIGYLFN